MRPEHPPQEDSAAPKSADSISDSFFWLRHIIDDPKEVDRIIAHSDLVVKDVEAIDENEWSGDVAKRLDELAEKINALAKEGGDEATYDVLNAILKKREVVAKTGSFFLFARLESLAAYVEDEGIYEERFTPFAISGEQQGLYTPEGELFISRDDIDTAVLKDLSEKIHELDYNIHNYELNGNIVGAPFTESSATLYEQEKKEKGVLLDKLRRDFFRPLTIEDLTATKIEPTEVKTSLADFASMVHGPMREIASFHLNYSSSYVDEGLGPSTGGNLSDLSLPEQFNLLSFFKEKRVADVTAVRGFALRYGTPGLRTFLALEHDRGFGESILAIGEKLPEQTARSVFKKYGELIDAATAAERYVVETFGKRGEKGAANTIAETLTTKANTLLRRVADDISKPEAPIDEVVDTLSIQLNEMEADVDLFLATFKTLALQGERMSLAEIRELSFESVHSKNLSQDDIDAMRRMYEKNYADKPVLRDALLQTFDAGIEDERTHDLSETDTRFYLLRRNGKIIAFDRFVEHAYAPDTTHLGAFNVDPTYQKHALGQTFLDETVKKESEEKQVVAECDAFAPMSMHYVEMGFVANRYFLFEGNPSLAIEYNANLETEGKHLSRETLMSRAIVPTALNPKESVHVVRVSDPREIPFSLLDEGFIMTRYLKESSGTYAAFERRA